MAARRSTRRRFDDDTWEPALAPAHDDHRPDQHDLRRRTGDRDDGGPDADDEPVSDDPDDPTLGEPSWSTYRDATRGPRPVPSWVVTDPRAIDTEHGTVKSGKEADVSVLERAVPPDLVAAGADGAHRCLLAVKRYRTAEHRMFHRDAGYLEGRRVRRSREMRAMATRTAFGRDLIAGQWAAAEFAILSQLWSRGAAVPYPVQLRGTELMMELIGETTGDAAGTAAPRLAQLRPSRTEAHDLYHQLTIALTDLAEIGYAHGDLSAYNVLVHEGRLVLIDLPQAVDLVGNPQGFDYLRRDCANIATWFAAHGAAHADADDLFLRVTRAVPGVNP